VRASRQESTSTAGVSEVAAKFERIGWGPVQNSAHDLGTDLLVAARDARRFERGLVIGAQVKAGQSWFDDEQRDGSGAVMGWWYYEPGVDHFDDWVTHGLPHLLILHDLDLNVSYWVHVTADAITRTGKGCKILVPAGQTIDNEHLEELLDVAAKQRARPILEGTSFAASVRAIPPGRRLRYALLAPRLIAPHRNAGYQNPIEPEEGVALLAQGRLLDLQRFAEHHSTIPDPRADNAGQDWRWSLVSALWWWMTEDDLAALRRVFDAAPDKPSRAATGVLTACAILRDEKYLEAFELLGDLVGPDDLGPIDHAWVLIQRARIRAEHGEFEEALEDAASAQRQLRGDDDDLTASALASAAAWQLYVTAGFRSADLGEVLSASDTAVSWWRSQTISWALQEASKQAFRFWGEDSSFQWNAEDLEMSNFFAAELNADLVGEHGAWRAISALSAKQRLMAARNQDDPLHEYAEALDALRRSGDAASLRLASAHLRRTGPVEAVLTAVGRVTNENWTHTNAKANFDLLSTAGDLVDEKQADRLIEWLGDLVRNDEKFVELTRPTFMVSLSVWDAIVGLLPSAGRQAHLLVAELLVAQSTPVLDVLVSPLTSLVRELDVGALPSETGEALLAWGAAERSRVGSTLLGELAELGLDGARSEVMRRATDGDLDALSAMGDITVLTVNQARSLIEKFEEMVNRTIDQADRHAYAFGGFDAGHGLALFNLWFQEVASWDSLVALLVNPHVASEHKRGACEVILNLADRVPGEIRVRLAQDLDLIGLTEDRDLPGGRTMGGIAQALGIAFEEATGPAADTELVQLALGSTQERSDAAALLGRGSCKSMRPILASLIADERSQVRNAAAQAVGRITATEPESLNLELARRLVADEGVGMPTAFMIGLSRGTGLSDPVVEMLRELSEHSSARVRRVALRLLSTK
jgi:hypothetical protein